MTSASTQNIHVKQNTQDISSGLEGEPEFCSDFHLCCGGTYIPVRMCKFPLDIRETTSLLWGRYLYGVHFGTLQACSGNLLFMDHHAANRMSVLVCLTPKHLLYRHSWGDAEGPGAHSDLIRISQYQYQLNSNLCTLQGSTPTSLQWYCSTQEVVSTNYSSQEMVSFRRW